MQIETTVNRGSMKNAPVIPKKKKAAYEIKSDVNTFITSALHFALQETKPDNVIGITDANWGP